MSDLTDEELLTVFKSGSESDLELLTSTEQNRLVTLTEPQQEKVGGGGLLDTIAKLPRVGEPGGFYDTSQPDPFNTLLNQIFSVPGKVLGVGTRALTAASAASGGLPAAPEGQSLLEYVNPQEILKSNEPLPVAEKGTGIVGEYADKALQFLAPFLLGRSPGPYKPGAVATEAYTAKDLELLNPSKVPVEGLPGFMKRIPNQPGSTSAPTLAAETRPPTAGRITPETKLEDLPQTSPTATTQVAEGSPVEKLTQALVDAKPLLKQQQAIYTTERAKRFAQAKAAGEGLPGMEGFRAELGQLRGKFDKVRFEPTQQKLTQADADSLMIMIRDSKKLGFTETLSARTGLAKILEGAVPTEGELGLLSEVFPPDFIAAVSAKYPLHHTLWRNTVDTLNIPRALRASVDLSAPFRQGVFLAPSYPREFGAAFSGMFKQAFSEKAYLKELEAIQQRPTYPLMRDSKLALTSNAPTLTAREESFMSSLAEKIPLAGKVIRGSNRAYSGFLTRLRADVFDSMYKAAQESGALKEFPGLEKGIAKFVNSATGRGSLGALEEAAPILNAAFFSPRLIASRINLLNPIYYARLPAPVRKQALKSLMSFVGVGFTTLTLAALGGADVGLVSTSADFGKLILGKTRYDIWGGFQQYAVAAARFMTNQMTSSVTGETKTLGEGFKSDTRLTVLGKFLRNKEAPVVAFAHNWASGRLSSGKEFSVTEEARKLLTPLILEDLNDLVTEEGLAAVPAIAPAVFGVGMQTY